MHAHGALCLSLSLLSGAALAAEKTAIDMLERPLKTSGEALHGKPQSESGPASEVHQKALGFCSLSLQEQARMIEPTEGISIGMELVSVAQRASNKATIDGRSESQINHRGDVFATLPGGKLGSSHERLFSHLRLGQGKGLENVRTGFSDPNASLFSDKSGGSAALAQLWYQLDAPLGDQKASGAEPLLQLRQNGPLFIF